MPPGRYASAYVDLTLDPNYVPPPPAAPAADPTYAPVEPGMYSAPYTEPGMAAPPPLPTYSSAPQTSGDVRSENYVPQEQGPGMYSPQYIKPGMAADLPPYTPDHYHPGNGNYPAVEPGMWDPRWQRPGQAVRTPATNEPGMYEPTYHQPGFYATRAASTYYGGQVWPRMFTGNERMLNDGTIQPGPPPDFIESLTPAAGTQHGRIVPNLGTADVTQEGTTPYPPRLSMGGALDRGDVLGALGYGAGQQGSAPPHPTVTLAPTSTETGYDVQQGDPAYVRSPGARGDLRIVSRRDLDAPIADALKGLFGGGQQKSSQPMPKPPKLRKR